MIRHLPGSGRLGERDRPTIERPQPKEPGPPSPRLVAAMQALARAEQAKRERAQREAENSALLQGLDGTFNDARSRLNAISDELDSLVRQGNQETIDKLEIAMGKVYKLAVFIRGDYDDRDHDDDDDAETKEKVAILAAAVAAFQEVNDLCQRRLVTMGTRHADVLQLENGVILPSRARVDELQRQVDSEDAALTQQLSDAAKAVSTMQNSVNQQQAAVDDLRHKVAQLKKEKGISNVVTTIATGGLGHIVRKGKPLDPFNYEGKLRDADNALRNSQDGLAKANIELEDINRMKASLDQRRARVNMTKALLPSLLSLAQATNNRCIALQQSLGPIKESASRLLTKVREVEHGAVVTQALAYSKKDIAIGLLQICNDSLMDSALADEARMIKDDVLQNYGGPVPDDVSEAATGVDGRIQLVANLLSIRG